MGVQSAPAGDIEKKQEYMRTVFAACGENSYIELPLRANWGDIICIWDRACISMPT